MLLLRQNTVLTLRALTARVPGVCGYCKDYSSSDDEKSTPKKPKQKKPKQLDAEVDKSAAPTAKETKGADAAGASDESAVTRLNRLLSIMPTEDQYSLTSQKRNAVATMARPGATHQKRKDVVKQEAESRDVFAAVKQIAALANDGEQQKQTESELLAKLLGHDQTAGVESATADAATGVDETSKKPIGDLSLSELIVGMKIDRTLKPKEQSRSEFVRRSLAAKTQRQQQQQQNQAGAQRAPGARKERKREAETYTGSVNLFGGAALGIFKNAAELRASPDLLDTWAQLEQHALQLQVAHPPANYFEKIALWTEQGKVWRFPIDNEQDMREEIDVDFSQHIFLEQHLEQWCPDKGPIRHFMELVCVGLSKNPYLSAKEKKDHILWYRDYFETKKDILKDLMSKQKSQPKIKAAEKQLKA